MSIEVVQTKRGERRYKVRLRDPLGREYSRRFRTKWEAETFAATERADHARGVWDSRGRKYLRVEQWARDWLNSHPAEEAIDRVCHRVIVERHINPSIGHLRLRVVTSRGIALLVEEWQKKLGDSWAPSVRGVVGNLRQRRESRNDPTLTMSSSHPSLNSSTQDST